MQESSASSSSSHLFRPLSIPPAESFKVAMQFGHETEAGRMLARLYGRSQEPVSAPPRALKKKKAIAFCATSIRTRS
jgi:hypothetical protein